MKKLNIGCGPNPLEGWLNCDIAPCMAGIRPLDATQPFPWIDDSFDRIFSEHMIEHVPFAGGVAMLRECYRVLTPGGRIRISTPSLEFLFGLLEHPTEETDRYVAWSCNLFKLGEPPCAEYVINYFVRAWGHQFIWSQDLLEEEMNNVGFDTYCPKHYIKIGESDDSEFVGLENATRMPPGFLQLETMTIEAEKPLA